MEKKRLTPRNIHREKFLSGKGRTRLIVDEYDSLNIINMKKQQQLIVCTFCQKQIPARLMISHKKICLQAEKKQQSIKKEIKKNKSKQSLNKNVSEVNFKNANQYQQAEKIQRDTNKRVQSINRGKSNLKKSNVSNIKRNPSKNQHIKRQKDMSSSAYIRPASVRKNSVPKNKKIHVQTTKQFPQRYNSINQNSKIKKTGIMNRNTRNYTQNNVQRPRNINQNRPADQPTTNNSRRNRRNRSRISENMSSHQSYYQQVHRGGPNIQANFNFINQTLNQQFSMFNNHFSMINDVLSNMHNYIPNVYDFSSQYYFQNPVHTMFFEQGYDSSSEEQQQQQQQTGLSEQMLSGIPKQKYSTRTHRSHQCTVCLCDLKDREIVKTLPCFHLFHSQCIDQWLRRKGICPICRQPL